MAGTAENVLTRSSRIHAARPTGSMRSMQTTHAPRSSAVTGPRIMRLRMVSGKQHADALVGGLRAPSPPRPTSSRLCWLCTTPFGRPVVPLVYAIAAGANGSTSAAGTESGSAARSCVAHVLAGSPGSASSSVRSAGRSSRERGDGCRGGAVTDEHRRAGVGEQVLLLGRGEAAVDADPDRAQVHRRQEEDHELGVVGHASGHPIARTHALGREHRRGAPNLLVKLSVREPGRTADERFGIRSSCNRCGQRRRHRVRSQRDVRPARRGRQPVARRHPQRPRCRTDYSDGATCAARPRRTNVRYQSPMSFVVLRPSGRNQ